MVQRLSCPPSTPCLATLEGQDFCFPACRRRKWKQGSQWCLRETLPGFPLPVCVGGTWLQTPAQVAPRSLTASSQSGPDPSPTEGTEQRPPCHPGDRDAGPEPQGPGPEPVDLLLRPGFWANMCFLDPRVWGQGGNMPKEGGRKPLLPVGALPITQGPEHGLLREAGPGGWAVLCAPQAGLPGPKGHGRFPRTPAGTGSPVPPSSQSWKQGLKEQVQAPGVHLGPRGPANLTTSDLSFIGPSTGRILDAGPRLPVLPANVAPGDPQYRAGTLTQCTPGLRVGVGRGEGPRTHRENCPGGPCWGGVGTSPGPGARAGEVRWETELHPPAPRAHPQLTCGGHGPRGPLGLPQSSWLPWRGCTLEGRAGRDRAQPRTSDVSPPLFLLLCLLHVCPALDVLGLLSCPSREMAERRPGTAGLSEATPS